MATGAQISFEAYLSTVYEPEMEYVEGELIERNAGEIDHSGVLGIVLAGLFELRRAAGVHIFLSLRVQVGPNRVRVPDLTVTTQKAKSGILHEPPFLCIEILSPEDRAGAFQSKIDDYLAFGVNYIWVVDPQDRKAWTYTRDGRIESPEVLTTADPDLSLRLADIFAALAEDVEPEAE